MKLHHSPASPYVRKVRICAITRGIDGRIELVPCNPNTSPAALLADNPLSKVPTLVTDDGVALFDSPVICEYLDSLGEALPMFPAHGAARWRALKLQAMGDGILDACVPRRMEMQRPQDEGRAAVDRAACARRWSARWTRWRRTRRTRGGHRLDRRGLRAGLPGFPLSAAAVAAASQAGGVVRGVQRSTPVAATVPRGDRSTCATPAPAAAVIRRWTCGRTRKAGTTGRRFATRRRTAGAARRRRSCSCWRRRQRTPAWADNACRRGPPASRAAALLAIGAQPWPLDAVQLHRRAGIFVRRVRIGAAGVGALRLTVGSRYLRGGH